MRLQTRRLYFIHHRRFLLVSQHQRKLDTNRGTDHGTQRYSPRKFQICISRLGTFPTFRNITSACTNVSEIYFTCHDPFDSSFEYTSIRNVGYIKTRRTCRDEEHFLRRWKDGKMDHVCRRQRKGIRICLARQGKTRQALTGVDSFQLEMYDKACTRPNERSFCLVDCILHVHRATYPLLLK